MKAFGICVVLASGLLFGLCNEASAANLLGDSGFDSSLADGSYWENLEWSSSGPWIGGGGGDGYYSGPYDYATGGGGSGIVRDDPLFWENFPLSYCPSKSPSNNGLSFLYGSVRAWSVISHQKIAVTPGQAYRASAYFNRAADSNIEAGHGKAALIISWITHEGGGRTQEVGTDKYSESDPANSWLLKAGTCVAPDDASEAWVGIVYERGECEVRDGGNSSYIHVDDISFEEISGERSGFELSSNYYDIHGSGEPIPEPASLLLLGSGLVGLFGVSRRKKN